MSGIMSWLGYDNSYPEPENIDKVEQIELLCERIRSCTLLEDKRQALVQLKEYSAKYKLEVGTRSLDIIIDIIGKYTHDKEIILLAFETLTNIIRRSKSVTSEEYKKEDNELSLSEQFCEILLKTSSNIQKILNLSDHQDFQIRWHVLKILTILARSQLKRLQEVLAEIHFVYSRILEYLLDSREVIRNDCVLLLLSLSQGDDHTQKILVFENMLDKLFDIILDESTDAIVINDCITIMINVLSENKLTQKSFQEFGLFSRVKTFFDQKFTDDTDLRVISFVHYLSKMVELCRIFLDSSRPSAYILESQNIISRTSLFRTFFSILSRSDICDELRVSTALVTSEIVFGNNKNQSLLSEFYEDFYRVDFADKVLSVAHDHTQSHAVRKSMLYLFGCYIRGNLSGLQKIVHGVLNQETSVVSKFLCAGLFDDDFMSTTITSFCFIHIMINNPQYKIEFARMAFIVDKSDSQTAFNLISRCVSIIQPQTNPISSINMLCLLIYLIYDCEEALNTFLESSDISSFMIMGIKSGYGSNLDMVIKGLFAVLVGTVLNALQERADSQITKNLMAHVSLVDLKSLITKLNESSEFVASSKSRIINLSLKVYIDYEITLIVKKIEIFVIDSLRYHSQDRSKLADLQDQLQAMTNEFKSVSEECKHLKNHLEAANKRVHDLEIKNDQLMRANNGLSRDFNVLLHDHQVLVSQYTYVEEEVRRLNYELYSVMGGQYHNMDSSLPETEGQIANQDLNKDNMTNVEYLDRS